MRLFLLFNHEITERQAADARASLGVEALVPMPAAVGRVWGSIPPDLPAIREYLAPVRAWLDALASSGDYVLIQGDFGACWLMVGYAFDRGLTPMYSTTERAATEEVGPDGAVTLTHRFIHRRFRRYGG
jgi:hypothetical protein